MEGLLFASVFREIKEVVKIASPPVHRTGAFPIAGWKWSLLFEILSSLDHAHSLFVFLPPYCPSSAFFAYCLCLPDLEVEGPERGLLFSLYHSRGDLIQIPDSEPWVCAHASHMCISSPNAPLASRLNS